MRLQFQRATLNEVLKFYVDAFETKSGETIVAWESWVDTARGEVVFELAVDEGKPKKSKSERSGSPD